MPLPSNVDATSAATSISSISLFFISLYQWHLFSLRRSLYNWTFSLSPPGDLSRQRSLRPNGALSDSLTCTSPRLLAAAPHRATSPPPLRHLASSPPRRMASSGGRPLSHGARRVHCFQPAAQALSPAPNAGMPRGRNARKRALQRRKARRRCVGRKRRQRGRVPGERDDAWPRRSGETGGARGLSIPKFNRGRRHLHPHPQILQKVAGRVLFARRISTLLPPLEP